MAGLVSVGLVAGITWANSAAGASTASSASVKAASGYASLAAAVEDGVVDPALAGHLAKHGSAKALVNFVYHDILEAGHATAGSESTRVAQAGAAYQVRKDVALDEVASQITVIQDYSSLPTTYVHVDSRSALLALANDPKVLSIRANHVKRASLSQSLPLVRQPEAAAAGRTGSGTAVAVLDTGVDYTRSAFGSCSSPGGTCKVAYAADFAPNDGVRDADGHGTNVAGIALGVAPSTKILSLDVFDGGGAYDSDIIDAINWVISTRATYGTRSVNLSLGDTSWHTTECSTSSYAGPFANLRAAGVLPVVAAGNDGYVGGTFRNGVSGPACAPGAVRVGAVYDANVGGMNWGDCNDSTTAANKITCFSQTGPILTVWAPGSPITAAGYTYSGTSQATPHVAGAAAAVGGAAPSATASQVQDAIATTGPNITDSRNGVTKHRLDVMAAVTAIGGESPSPTPSPTTSPSPTPSPTTTPSPGSTTTTGTLSGYYGSSGNVYLYRYWKDVYFTGRLTPAQNGNLLHFEWQKRNSTGSWTTLADAAFAQDAGGSVTIYISHNDLAKGTRYRLRAYYAGDATHGSSSSVYSMFKMTN